jgi:hypothetical protein
VYRHRNTGTEKSTVYQERDQGRGTRGEIRGYSALSKVGCTQIAF